MNFYKRMSLVCALIPEGCVATYRQIALLCGKPKNSRQVGYGLNHDLAGPDVPAHRIVNSKGILSGAASFDFPDLQKRLLEEEGVEVTGMPVAWQVDLKIYGWKHTFDQAEHLFMLFQKEGI